MSGSPAETGDGGSGREDELTGGTQDRPEHSDYPDYPVVLSVVGRSCLVVGAGPVAARKGRGLLTCGARLTVIAPEVGDAMAKVLAETPAGRARLEQRPYRDGEAADYELVVAATGDETVDLRVSSDALSAGALVNGAPAEHVRSVHLPAVHRQGRVTIAVSTGGRSPALAAWVRTRLAQMPGPDLAVLASLLGEARHEMLDEDSAPPRSLDWPDVIDQLAPLVEAGRIDEAKDTLRRLFRP